MYEKNNEHFKDKARSECLWKQFANRCAGPGLTRKGHVTASLHNQSLDRLQRR